MGLNNRDGEELFKLKDSAGTRINGYKVVMSKFKMQIRRMYLPSKK